jgi:hydroxymethylpyrimidine pyrophosphatase-like HAD family hydrolase
MRAIENIKVTNLLSDLDALARLLDEAACKQNWVDAFLVAAGINQIVEDRLHNSPFPFDDAASLLGKSASRIGRLAGRTAAGTGLALRRLTLQGRGARHTLAWQRNVAGIVDELADAVIADDDASPWLSDRCRAVALEIATLPADLRREVLRLPACFYNFDQRPEDLMALAERFDERWPARDRPVLVVGIRTSGSYLAPLLAAALRARGRPGTRFITARPGRALLAAERAMGHAAARHGGAALLVDDPPVTGGSIAASARVLERLGIDRVLLALALDTDSVELPPALAAYDAVVLPANDWTAHRALEPLAVQTALTHQLDGELELRSVQELPLPGAPTRRGHRQALLRVGGVDRADGSERRLDVLASTVGLGYFGTHQEAVSQALDAFTPRVLGLRDGALYREWLPAEREITSDSPEFPAALASYVAARRDALPVPRDPSTAMAGQRPAWEVAGLVLARGFARAAPAARVLVVNRAVQRLLRVSHPSVVDGSTTPGHWFADDGGTPMKVGLSDRTYWNLGLACFDATFDLAGAVASEPNGTLPARVRSAWLQQTGEIVDPERWLLYELAHQWGRLRAEPSCEAEVRQASARAAARYFADAFCADLDDATGPLCALDIDGVLEGEQLGFPALTRASATALRALIAHGYRPVLVTGRGLDEVRDRCRAYGLIGGVAEYGSAVYLHAGERTVSLLDGASAAVIDRTRAVLREREGVRLDPAFGYALRAYRLGADGKRRPLSPDEIADAVHRCAGAGAIRAIQGQSQTDFVPAAIDKGTGLRALASALGDTPDVALAVGDTAADAPMLALASRAFVPAHAAHAATLTGAKRVSRPYQAGLSQAVATLLGHRPGTCPCCEVSPASTERELLLDLLSIAEDGPRGLMLGAFKLARELR